jgi:hypothetical protein
LSAGLAVSLVSVGLSAFGVSTFGVVGFGVGLASTDVLLGIFASLGSVCLVMLFGAGGGGGSASGMVSTGGIIGMELGANPGAPTSGNPPKPPPRKSGRLSCAQRLAVRHTYAVPLKKIF